MAQVVGRSPQQDLTAIMLDDSNVGGEREPLSPARRATPAGIDILALCRSLPPDGRLSKDDLDLLRDWASRYHDVSLPAQEYLSGVVTKALVDERLTADERDWVYFAVESVLPVQLRKSTQDERRVAELLKAESDGRADATLSFDFLLAGVHLDGRWQTIQSHVKAGDVVYLVRSPADALRDERVRVVLPTGECIGFVPEEDALPIAPEVARGARVEATVRKILAGGQYPIPVIGGRVHCSASTLDGNLDDPDFEWTPVDRHPSRSMMITVACVGGAALLALALLLR
jgi:hypothetical protein